MSKILIFLLFVCIMLSAFLIGYTNHAASFDYDLTRAVCENNVCRDYKITCSGREVVRIEPLTGFVTFPATWSDERPSESFCSYNYREFRYR